MRLILILAVTLLLTGCPSIKNIDKPGSPVIVVEDVGYVMKMSVTDTAVPAVLPVITKPVVQPVVTKPPFKRALPEIVPDEYPSLEEYTPPEEITLPAWVVMGLVSLLMIAPFITIFILAYFNRIRRIYG